LYLFYRKKTPKTRRTKALLEAAGCPSTSWFTPLDVYQTSIILNPSIIHLRATGYTHGIHNFEWQLTKELSSNGQDTGLFVIYYFGKMHICEISK